MAKKITICLVSEKWNDIYLMLEAEKALQEAGFLICEEIAVTKNQKYQRWERWIKVEFCELRWCQCCENYTYRQKGMCRDCGSPY